MAIDNNQNGQPAEPKKSVSEEKQVAVPTTLKGLQNPVERGTALRLFFYLPLLERQSLLDELVELASVGHSDIELCREAILSLPKGWLLANIEKSAEGLLADGTDEEYRRLLELYIKIDDCLTEKLVKRALQHEDADIREAGEDFQKYLKNFSGR